MAIEQIDPDYIVPIQIEARDCFSKSFENVVLVEEGRPYEFEMYPSYTPHLLVAWDSKMVRSAGDRLQEALKVRMRMSHGSGDIWLN